MKIWNRCAKKPLEIPEGTCGDLTFQFGRWKIIFQGHKGSLLILFILSCSLFVKSKGRHDESIILAYIIVRPVNFSFITFFFF